jgi:hypothetical protein
MVRTFPVIVCWHSPIRPQSGRAHGLHQSLLEGGHVLISQSRRSSSLRTTEWVYCGEEIIERSKRFSPAREASSVKALSYVKEPFPLLQVAPKPIHARIGPRAVVCDAVGRASTSAAQAPLRCPSADIITIMRSQLEGTVVYWFVCPACRAVRAITLQGGPDVVSRTPQMPGRDQESWDTMGTMRQRLDTGQCRVTHDFAERSADVCCGRC